jgi:hypothetical protein
MGNSFQAWALLSMAFGILFCLSLKNCGQVALFFCSGLVLGFMVKE